MRIKSVRSSRYRVPIDVPLLDTQIHREFVLVEVRTEDDEVGYGLCGRPGMFDTVIEFIDNAVGPYLAGRDASGSEEILTILERKHNHRRMGGLWASAFSGIDIALWDLRGKAAGKSITTLLGGARRAVPVYLTYGVTEMSIEQLQAVGEQLVGEGYSRLKMIVGGFSYLHEVAGGREARGEGLGFDIAEDARRVAAVREAIGGDAELAIDANCAFSLPEALDLAKRVEPYRIAWFEEPVVANDVALLREFRRQSPIPLSAGQTLSNLWEHRPLLAGNLIDYSQPNVCHGGGFTTCLKVAHLAEAFNIQIRNGGGWPHHNLHVQAGVPNGGLVELHWLAWKAGEAMFSNPPVVEGEHMLVPDRPGLGMEPDLDALDAYRVTR